MKSTAVFSEKMLLSVAANLKSGRLPLKRTQLSDDMVTGLRAVVYETGEISYHASYHFDDQRPFLRIGSANRDSPDYISLSDAREITNTVKALAAKGVNVQDGLLPRLIRELLRDGLGWRPK
jgi:hypothetical protein